MNNNLHSTVQGEAASARGTNDPRESERPYRLLFENNPQPMWVFDSETLAFLDVNDAAIRQYGYSRDEFLSMTIKEIRPAEDVSKLSDFKARSRNGFGSYDDSCHWRHQRKDGRLIDVEVTWHTLEFDGRPARLVLAHDVTERRKTGAEIRYQQSLFHQLLDRERLSRSICRELIPSPTQMRVASPGGRFPVGTKPSCWLRTK